MTKNVTLERFILNYEHILRGGERERGWLNFKDILRGNPRFF